MSVMRNVILAINGTECYLDKTDTGYLVTRNFCDLSLCFADENEAINFINKFHSGDKELIPTYIEWELYRKAA